MPIKVPAINETICGNWSVQDRQLYNALPLHLQEATVKFRERFMKFTDIFGKNKWTPNEGESQKQVVAEPPPLLRQHAFGSPICGPAKRDTTQYRERLVPMYLARHRFQSPAFCWCPAFFDFVKNKINKQMKFLLQNQRDFEMIFYRSALFHESPTMILADGIDSTTMGNGYSGGVHYTSPTGQGTEDGTAIKSLNYLSYLAPLVGNPGNLSMRTILRSVNILEEDIGAVPYQSGTVAQDSPMNDKFLLLTSGEAFTQLSDDPLYKEDRPDNEDAIRKGFSGRIRDRVIVRSHTHPLRLYINPTTGVASWPQPESILEDTTNPDFGKTIPNPFYRAAQFEFAILVGDKPGEIVDPGPPPAEFAAKGMDWNGKATIETNFLIDCLDADGTTVRQEFNTEREWLKIFSTLAVGYSPINRRNAAVIMFKRKRDTTTFLY